MLSSIAVVSIKINYYNIHNPRGALYEFINALISNNIINYIIFMANNIHGYNINNT